ncbi:hypothetical protein JMJ56_27400 [Belnapia sp. T18]|uniref:Phosphatidate cytidylyltransferase n=1 Tax=Belnapia arida TaxID=2804533 RepID=A0ABS1UDF9_9PROT|nr:hypothetical protein [Belnapia arida]MBL6081712.1 hypothetical protein [Belnapia arida]
MTPAAPANLEALVAAELATPAEPGAAILAARQLAEDILARHRVGVEAVLFYGACRLDDDPAGLLDLYVLTSGHRAFHRRWLPALFNALLPPTVLHWRSDGLAGPIRAKVAVLTLRQFERRLRPASLDTTIWARFCQPSTLVHARDTTARHRVEQAVAQALTTAVLWAVRLGPPAATPMEYWRGLLAHTYSAELRVERGSRSERLLAASPSWYAPALILALARLGLATAADAEGRLRPGSPQNFTLSWATRRVCGKTLNVMRLVKAAFTFDGGPDYLTSKIARHSGVAIELTAWQRRHPVLAAPILLWRLRRDGAVR